MVRRCLLAALVLLGVIAAVPSATAAETCRDDTDTAALTGDIRVAKPATPPNAVVAFFHGYGHTTESWEHHMRWAATELGVLSIAAEYDGWQVQLGADRTLEALTGYLHCSDHVIAYGVSMGGNASGLAVAHDEVFDHWIAVEGVHNVTETYLEARTLAPANEYAAGAVEHIRAEMGGHLEEQPEAYRRHTNVLRAADIAERIEGVVLVHGVGDGIVPYNQSREMQAALLALGEPTDFYTVVLRDGDGEDEQGTTVDGYVPVDHDSPFAGHGSEAAEDHRVICEGFERLAEVVDGSTPTGVDVLVDAQASTCNLNRST